MALIKKTVAELLALNLKDFIIEIEAHKMYVIKQSSDPELTNVEKSVRNAVANQGIIVPPKYSDYAYFILVHELTNAEEETKTFKEARPITAFDTAILAMEGVLVNRLPQSDMALTILSATGANNTIQVNYSLEGISMEGLSSLYKKVGEEFTLLATHAVSDSGEDSISTSDNIEAGEYSLLLEVQTAVDGLKIATTNVTVTN